MFSRAVKGEYNVIGISSPIVLWEVGMMKKKKLLVYFIFPYSHVLSGFHTT